MSLTPEELDHIKRAFKRMHEEIQQLWLEKQLLRNHIIDSGWMPEADLDAAIEKGKKHPTNILHMKETFAESEQSLAELGLADWLAKLREKLSSKRLNLITQSPKSCCPVTVSSVFTLSSCFVKYVIASTGGRNGWPEKGPQGRPQGLNRVRKTAMISKARSEGGSRRG
jgi:hypothetical protein